MFYHIERTLEFLPGVACTILVLVFLFLEVKNVKEQLRDKPVPEPGRGSFCLLYTSPSPRDCS